MGSSKKVILAKAWFSTRGGHAQGRRVATTRIQKVLKSLDSRLRGNDELRIIKGTLMIV